MMVERITCLTFEATGFMIEVTEITQFKLR